MQGGKKPILYEGFMKNAVNKDTFTGFAYTIFNFFPPQATKKC